MDRSSQRKGRDYEIEVRNAFANAGFRVRRNGLYEPDDIVVTLGGRDWTVECKRRARGFSGLYGYLEGRDAVVHRDDRRSSLITMPLERFLELIIGTAGP